MGYHSSCIAVLRCLVIMNPTLKTAFAPSCEVRNGEAENNIPGKSVVLGADVKVRMCDIFAKNVMLAEYVWMRRKADFRWLRMYGCVLLGEIQLAEYI